MARVELDTQDPPRYESLQDNNTNHSSQDIAKDDLNYNNVNNDQQKHKHPQSIPPIALQVPPQPTPAWQHHLERIIGAVATPVNAIAVRRGTNSFIPESAARELWKATKILEGFTFSGSDTASSPSQQTTTRGRGHGRGHGHELIPASSLSAENCTALLILTTFRVGLRHVTISTGSGILLVRRPHPNPGPDTSSASSWAPPVLVKTTSLGAGPFAMGLDVSDRVYVIKTKEGLDMLLQGGGRTMTMGSAEGVVAVGRKGVGGGVGFPFGMGMGSSDKKERCEGCGREQSGEGGEGGEENRKGGVREALNQPIQCYVRSAGLYCGVQAEGVMITEREEENKGFYGRDVSVVRGVLPAGEEEKGFGDECKEGLNALRVVLGRAEAGREKVE
ncbi:hypothetical protein B0T14DRAFT_88866 [Immersiella caudata]|uniref:Ysc84 actin-binding domain-containing protein n=1 Tax=Immersiella caudata TaxID=314043 RepID=A0AA39X279_9PEZI|nr:hypothetical protein B0T14DRAFT_88866 [Immersiella caudata]